MIILTTRPLSTGLKIFCSLRIILSSLFFLCLILFLWLFASLLVNVSWEANVYYLCTLLCFERCLCTKVHSSQLSFGRWQTESETLCRLLLRLNGCDKRFEKVRCKKVTSAIFGSNSGEEHCRLWLNPRFLWWCLNHFVMLWCYYLLCAKCN